MKLIEVQAHGFKSFADRVTLKFDGGIVAIVGPNGSGKSNINDAIRWVLGETSSKALRGDTMSDVIFAGSESQEPMERAEVILTFDNSDRAVNIPHDVFTISRVLNRGKGSNEYYINGELARMKDIKEIAMQSGISKSSLAIISQGTISDVAEATPERRREFFEEAAGTSMYKTRKKEALSKLQKTEESLNVIAAKVQELDKQLTPLKRQASKAEEYIEKSNQLKDVEISLLVHEIDQAQNKNSKIQNENGAGEEVLKQLSDEIKALENEATVVSKERTNVDSEVEKLRSEIEEISEQIVNLKLRDAGTKQQQEWILQGKINVSKEEEISTLKARIEELNARIISFKQLEKDYKEKSQTESSQALKFSENIYEVKNKRSVVYKQRSDVQARISNLKDMKDNGLNFARATKLILDHSHLFKGFKGTVAQLLEVPSQYATAVEVVLANALQNIVVTDDKTAVEAIEFLKKNKGGRTSFIPLASISERSIREDHIRVAKTHPGFVGVLADFINTKPEFDKLKRFLMGHIILANNIDEATKISQLLEKRYMIVTLEGDIIRIGGVITGGQAPQTNNVFQLDENIKKLEDLLPNIEEEITRFETEVQELELQYNKHTSAARELMIEAVKINENVLKDTKEFDELTVRYEALAKEKIQLNENINFVESIEILASQKSAKEALLETTKQHQNAVNARLNLIIDKKTKLDSKYRFESEQFNRVSIEKTRNEAIIQQAARRLSEQYSLTFEVAKEEYYNPEIDYSVSKKIVLQLQQEIKELGNVNLQAIEQVKEVQERYDIHKKTEDELTEAVNKINQAIDEMDKMIIAKIKNTVNLVNNEFKYVFNKMFGGGMAEIRFTEPDNLLDSGLDIIAQPPGKSIKNLKLFSGGEKALIAISLLFSILKAKPLPLCILDEVEAALDEANVIRFAEFLHKLKADTQFIVITHRQGTMERVDRLYGATMQNRGITTFLSVALEKAKELVDEERK
ncbi:AAA family ATPase [Mycoplasma sp. 3341]|uniref:AAA family ATPase n=1 Tax=Mycoplasma sp. 3341 TaxID=3447506 RepID=UPI003F65A4BF